MKYAKKFFIALCIVLTLFMNFESSILSYAYNRNLEKNYSYATNGRVAVPLAVPLITTYAVPALLNISCVFVMGLTAIDNAVVDHNATQEYLSGLQKGYDKPEVIEYVSNAIKKLHPATIGYLVLAGAGGDSATVEGEMEEAGWNPQFIQNVKEELGGGSGGGSDQDPKWKITAEALKKFGVISALSVGFIGGLLSLLKSVFSDGSSTSELRFGPVSGTGSFAYRSVPLRAGESGRTTGQGSFNMRWAKDLNMDLVKQVNIQMGKTKLYNYGWDGVVYKQEYLLKSLNGNGMFLFLVFIGKALSPNQYIDREWDGVTYAFYQLDDAMNIVQSAWNMYNVSLDTARLEMGTSTVSKIGTNLYRKTGPNDVTGFKYMRNQIKEALGADLFPQFDSSYNFLDSTGNYTAGATPFCDFSKGVTGTYNSVWTPTEGEAIFTEFGKDGNLSFVFPDSGISAGKDYIGNSREDFTVGTTGSNWGHSVVDKIETGNDIFSNPSSGNNIKVDELPTNTDLDTTFPDVGNVDVGEGDSGGDSGGDSVVDLSGILAFLKMIYDAIMSIISTLKTLTSPVTDAISNAVNTMVTWYTSLDTKVGDLGVSIGDNLSELGINIGDNLSELGINIGKSISDLGTSIGDFLTELDVSIGDLGISIGNSIKELGKGLGDILSSILTTVSEISTNTFDFSKLKELVIELFVPAESYWVDKFTEIKQQLEPKIPIGDIERLETIATSESLFKDIYVTIFGQRVLIARLSLMNKFIPWAKPILQGIIALFLLIYNYNQVYKLIRGSSLVGAQGTLANMQLKGDD